MKALLSKTVGGPDALVLEDVAAPQARPGAVVVQVMAAGVNFPDVLIIEDKYQHRPVRPFAPGSEFCGLVKAVGADVTHLRVGDRVFGHAGFGCFAEEVLVDADYVFPAPASLSFEEAGGSVLTYGTSHHALHDRARLKAGETLLVLGAAGGVGIAAVEIAKALRARVVAAASTQEKVDFCISRGADAGVVYGRGPFDTEGKKRLSQQFKEALGEEGAHVIYDAVGGDYAEPALRAIAWEGRYLVVGFAAGDIPRIPLNLALLKGCQIVGVIWGGWARRNPEGHRAGMAELAKLYDSGKLRPFVSETFPLAQGAEAIRRLGDRHALGKVVVTMPALTGG